MCRLHQPSFQRTDRAHRPSASQSSRQSVTVRVSFGARQGHHHPFRFPRQMSHLDGYQLTAPKRAEETCLQQGPIAVLSERVRLLLKRSQKSRNMFQPQRPGLVSGDRGRAEYLRADCAGTGSPSGGGATMAHGVGPVIPESCEQCQSRKEKVNVYSDH